MGGEAVLLLLLYLLAFFIRMISFDPLPYSHQEKFQPHPNSPCYHCLPPYATRTTRMMRTKKGYFPMTMTTTRTRNRTKRTTTETTTSPPNFSYQAIVVSVFGFLQYMPLITHGGGGRASYTAMTPPPSSCTIHPIPVLVLLLLPLLLLSPILLNFH